MDNAGLLDTREVYSPHKETVAFLRDELTRKNGFNGESVQNEDDFFELCAKVAEVKPRPADVVVPDPLYRTVSHRELLRNLVFAVRGLSNGEFYGKNGVHSATLFGAKGIGKSTVLRTFASLCSVFCPNVVAVVISCQTAANSRSLVRKKSFLNLVLDAMIEGGYFPKDTEIPPDLLYGEFLAKLLRGSKLRLLLLVDDLDQLYRVNPASLAGDICVCVDSLGDLAYLGNQVTGRFATFLCGSSSALPSLVTRNTRDPWFLSEYPLLTTAPDLNDQKFSSRPIDSNTPVTLDTVKQVLGPGLSTEMARLFAFCVGTIPRLLENIGSILLGGKLFESVSPDESTLERLDRDFFDAIIQRLYMKNKDLIDGLFREDGRMDVAKICTTPWEEAFIPLCFSELDDICSAFCEEGKPIASPRVSFIRLSDKCWILAATGTGIYPYSLMQVAKFGRDHEVVQSAQDAIGEALLKYAKRD